MAVMGTPIAPSTPASTDTPASQPTKARTKQARAASQATAEHTGRPKLTRPETEPAPTQHVHCCACGWTQPTRQANGTSKIAWTDAERQTLAAMIAENGPYQGCKQYAAAHPERTALGCQYQWTNRIKGKSGASAD